MSYYVNCEVIKNYIKENNLSKTKFCKLCKISLQTFNKVLNGEDVYLGALFKISRALNINISVLFKVTEK
ncbi:MAG: helix-turn-helix domain-containing protein [Clostridia bacterium]|nr:helix-turn-helix domain-containing protein [Clostridia bacterium]